MFLTHSIFPEENENAIRDSLERFGVEDDWYLDYVLPEVESDNQYEGALGNFLFNPPSFRQFRRMPQNITFREWKWGLHCLYSTYYKRSGN